MSLIPMLVVRARSSSPPGRATSTCPRSAGQFHVPGQRCTSASPSRCCSWSSAPSLVFGFFRFAAAKRAMVPGQAPVRRRGGLRLRPQPHGPRHHRQPRLHAVRAVPVHAVLLRADQQLVRHRSRSSSSRRSPAPAWSTRWPCQLAGLQLVGVKASTASSATSSCSACRPASPARCWLLLVPLEFFSNILVRPVTLALRLFAQHVRRPHPADPVRARRPVPPRRTARPSSSRSASSPG